MGTFDNIKDKLGDLVDSQGDKISQGLDKASEFVDSKTGGKHTDQIATGEEKLKDVLDGLDGEADDIPNTPPRVHKGQ